MNDSATVLVAAFGGGLAGAILQPVVAHVLGRFRSKEERLKGRQATLRKMLSAWLGWGLRVGQAIILVQAHRAVGKEGPSDSQISKMLRQGDLPAWEPERIADVEFQKAATDFYWTATEAAIKMLDENIEDKVLADSHHKIALLRNKLILGMDERDWPEASS